MATELAEREPALELSEELAGELWQPRFPDSELVQVAADMLPDQPCGQGHEGPDWRITVSPGKVKVWTRDENRYERTENRELDGRRKNADAQATWLADGEDIPEREPSREIIGWSRKSRARMVERLCDLDYSLLFGDPRRLVAMVTLTYPGDWLTVAPNGRATKRHLKELRKRYKRHFEEDLACVWKLEFQARGAPHFHLMMTPPHERSRIDNRAFRAWISWHWADIVAHPDPDERYRHECAGTGIDWNEGLKATDPRRVAVYFTKHGAFKSKEYQHCVPEAWREPGQGPGRFWGYWVLAPATSTRAVSTDLGTQAGRILRRWSRAQRVTQQVSRPRAAGGVPVSKYPDVQGLAGKLLVQSRRVQYRRTRVRAVRARNGRGWVSVNNGPDFAVELGYALRQGLDQRDRENHERELRRVGRWNTPLARARRLKPGACRDALIEKLAARFRA